MGEEAVCRTAVSHRRRTTQRVSDSVAEKQDMDRKTRLPAISLSLVVLQHRNRRRLLRLLPLSRAFTGKTISDAEFSEVRGQGGTMIVGTFGPMEWGAVVGLITEL